MMLSPQKYQNTSRTITGLLNFVFTSDVLIFCDTSAGAVAITLLEIPSNFWNTSYKLYIIDANNNAQTNNITINAPVGFQVNNASNLVISTNGGIALIRIVNNTDYLAEFNFNAGALAVLNEGVLLTPNATSMDFIGSYVNATNVGSAVSVLIQPSIISLTYAQLQTAITNSTLIAGQTYSITNATFIQTTSETAPIYLLATSTNTISAEGQGRFLNADYQLVGNYSGVTGFVNALGVWNLLAPVVVGSVVIWNNFQYVSLTGINNQPNLNPLDWALLTKTLTTGYILEVCTILYDVNTNSIYKRIDLNNNSVENNISTYISVGIEAFQVFQWGAPILCRDNLISNESLLNNCNNQGLVISNSIQNASIVKIQHGGTSQQTELKQNFICENSSLTFTIDSNLNRFNNNNVRNKAIVTFDPLGDPNPTLGLIAENDFVNCELTLGVFLFADILRGNVFNGVVGQIINFQGTFTNNSFISSSSYSFAISNQGTGTTGNFSANQINYCNVNIDNLGNIVENILEYSTIIILSNTSSGNIQKNIVKNSSLQTTNDGNINYNNFYDSILSLGNNEGNINYNSVTNNSIIQNNSNADPQLEIVGNVICENSNLTFNVGLIHNRFNNNNLRNKAIVTLDPLGDPNATLGLIAENDFVNCELFLGVFLFADILRGNVFNGVVGQIINFQGIFTNNIFTSTSSLFFGISNGGTGNFSANQINYCNIDISNGGNFVENILEYSTINIGSNTSSGNIQKNRVTNSTWGITIQNNSNIRFNNFFDSQITFVDNNGNIQYNQVIDNSTLQITSNSGSFTNNNIDFSTLTIDSLGITSFASNIIENLSIISITNCANSIAQNNFYRFTFQVTTNNCNVFRNNLRSSGIVVTDLSTTTLTDILGNLNILFAGVFTEAISSGLIQEGLTSTSISLDVQNGAIYDAITQTLTIPNELTNVCGIIVLQNGVAPITISKISGGLPTGFGAMKFINSTGFNVDFVSTPIGIAVNDDIISNLAPNTYTIVDRVNGGDTIQIIRSGNFVAIQEVYIYI